MAHSRRRDRHDACSGGAEAHQKTAPPEKGARACVAEANALRKREPPHSDAGAAVGGRGKMSKAGVAEANNARAPWGGQYKRA